MLLKAIWNPTFRVQYIIYTIYKDKSSNSDVKMSQSNNPERSSFMDSKQSEGTYSDSDSKRDQSEQ